MKTRNKIISSLLAVIILVGLLPIGSVFAAAPQLSADGFYLINTKEDLIWFRDTVNSGSHNINGRFMKDIVLNEGEFDKNKKETAPFGSTAPFVWTPIGNKSTPYTGRFDGMGHTVSGLYFFSNSVDYIGLFGSVSGSEISDVTVSNGMSYGRTYCGGIAGHAVNSKFTNCKNNGVLVFAFVQFSGGIAGDSQDTVFTNCKNTAEVHSMPESQSTAGGIVGQIRLTKNIGRDTAVISNCENRGKVICSTADFNFCTGGIVGACYGYSDCDALYEEGLYSEVTPGGKVYRAIIENSKNFGAVTSCEIATGGIVGYAENVSLVGCTNEGTVEGLNPNISEPPVPEIPNGSGVGGIAGFLVSYSNVNNCVNKGNVSGIMLVGGIVGVAETLYTGNNVTISNCKNFGSVTATITAQKDANGNYAPNKNTEYYVFNHTGSAGGIVGLAVDSAYEHGVKPDAYKGGSLKILNSVNIGTVLAPNAPVAGGIVGYLCGAEIESYCNRGTVKGLDSFGAAAGYRFDSYHKATVKANSDFSGHTFKYEQKTDTEHLKKCVCGESYMEAHKYGDGNICDLCGYETNNEYIIIEGADQTVEKGNPAAFVSNAEFLKFLKVLVDGTELAPDNYIAESGTTKVTLKKEYINTLTEGEHTLEIISNDGAAKTLFTVVKPTVSEFKPEPPKDDEKENNFGIVILIVIITVVLAGGTAAAVLLIKKKNSEK